MCASFGGGENLRYILLPILLRRSWEGAFTAASILTTSSPTRYCIDCALEGLWCRTSSAQVSCTSHLSEYSIYGAGLLATRGGKANHKCATGPLEIVSTLGGPRTILSAFCILYMSLCV